MAYTIFILHLFLTCIMLGLIWFVQVIHYPFLSRMGETNAWLEAWYVRRMLYCVSIPMGLEFITGSWLVVHKLPFISDEFIWLNFVLLIVIWISSLCIQLPLHCKLVRTGFNQQLYRRLEKTNWIRTVAWSLRAVLLFCIVYRLLD